MRDCSVCDQPMNAKGLGRGPIYCSMRCFRAWRYLAAPSALDVEEFRWAAASGHSRRLKRLWDRKARQDFHAAPARLRPAKPETYRQAVARRERALAGKESQRVKGAERMRRINEARWGVKA